MMRPPLALHLDDDLHVAFETMLAHGLRRLPVLDDGGTVVAIIDEVTIARAYLRGHAGEPRGD